ncbi:aldo/keto reductase, partial [Burkholderia cenocepacia]|uniref:aldo/keto reductase n=1 Tax=Burkholderia cenocepacia TaxID=95486 RepID=UPI0024B733EE
FCNLRGRDVAQADVPDQPAQVAEGRRICDIVCVQNHYNIAHRGDDALIDTLARDGIAYVPYFPLGGFSPLQSSTLSDVA